MAHRISIEQTAEENGYDLNNDNDMCTLMLFESIVPACCSEGCMVEVDGHCPHGFPAITMELI